MMLRGLPEEAEKPGDDQLKFTCWLYWFEYQMHFEDYTRAS